MPLVKYILTVGVTSTEHPADLIAHVRAALEAATGITAVLEIAPLPIAASPSPTTPPSPAIPRHDEDDDEPKPKKAKHEKSNN